MTEAEWLACQDPTPMLEFLRGKVSERKLRLFAVACCRRAARLLGTEKDIRWVQVVEQHADDRVSMSELAFAQVVTHGNVEVSAQGENRDYLRAIYALTCGRCTEAVRRSARAVAITHREEPTAQASLLRCIFNNPFRPIRPDPAWQTPNAVTLAQTIYDERRFDLLPLLADLLEEAGCPREVSDHCRGEGPHARGCWVVDLVLGKE